MTVEQYHTMIDQGILGPGDPVELLEGVIVQKMSKKPPHRIATHATRQALQRLVSKGWYVDTQEPITLEASEPEPDVSVIRGDTRDYSDRHPGPNDVGLIVEVADASLKRDRIVKKRIYATAGIPFYWVLDLTRRRLVVYSEPQGADYSRRVLYAPDQSVAVILDGRAVGNVAVSDLLP